MSQNQSQSQNRPNKSAQVSAETVKQQNFNWTTHGLQHSTLIVLGLMTLVRDVVHSAEHMQMIRHFQPSIHSPSGAQMSMLGTQVFIHSNSTHIVYVYKTQGDIHGSYHPVIATITPTGTVYTYHGQNGLVNTQNGYIQQDVSQNLSPVSHSRVHAAEHFRTELSHHDPVQVQDIIALRDDVQAITGVPLNDWFEQASSYGTDTTKAVLSDNILSQINVLSELSIMDSIHAIRDLVSFSEDLFSEFGTWIEAKFDDLLGLQVSDIAKHMPPGPFMPDNDNIDIPTQQMSGQDSPHISPYDLVTEQPVVPEMHIDANTIPELIQHNSDDDTVDHDNGLGNMDT